MRLGTLIALLLLLGCSDATGPRSDLLRVTPHRTVLSLTNLTGEPVFYMVAEREFLTLADLAQFCNDPELCQRVPARGTVRVSNADIVGYDRGDQEAVVYHWLLVPSGDGGFEVSQLRTIVTLLR